MTDKNIMKTECKGERFFAPTAGRNMVLPLLLATFLIYINSLPNDFIFDDVPLVQNSLNVMNMGFFDLVTSYRPLRYLSYALDYRIDRKSVV